GRPLAEVGSLSGRPVSPDNVRAAATAAHDQRAAVRGTALRHPWQPAAAGAWAPLGEGGRAPVPAASRHPGLAAPPRARDDGLPAPAVVVLPWPTAETPGLPAPEAVHAAVA
ncbi:hypothetical protein VM98_36785, partial [Streptomyces rubellomurinus subsp. indigoferus]